MIKDYGLHRAQDVAIACHELRHAICKLRDADESTPVGLGLAAGVAKVLEDALDRYWFSVRPTVCLACGHVHDHEWTLCEHCGEDSAR